jgi:type II secretory pathway component PulF
MKAVSLFFATRTFRARRAAIYQKMAFGLKRGGTPSGELKAMYANSVRRRSSLAPVYKYWHESLRGRAAGRLARAMQYTIPESEYGLLRIAEDNQALAHGFDFLSVSVKRVNEMRRSFIDALRSVAIPVVLLCGLIIGIDIYFFPLVEDTLPRREWPVLTRLVASVAHQMGSILTGLVFAMPLLLAAWAWSLPRLTGPLRTAAEHIPLLYTKYRDFQCVIFQVNLAFLREANVSPRSALEKIESIATPYMRSHVQAMLGKLNKEATNFGDVLVSTGLFKPDLADLISDYARWPDWQTQMRSIADTSLDIVTDEVKRFGPLIQQILQVVIGVIIFIIMAASAAAMIKTMGKGL